MPSLLNSPTLKLVAEEELELTVVMPCLNEARTLPVCIQKALATMEQLGIKGEVLIVDNGSSDNSMAVAMEHGARVVRHWTKGYGNALRRGFEEARGRFIVMGDCDDSYDFTDLGRFVEQLRNGADVVMGNRLKGHIVPGAMPWLHKWVGNPGLSWFLNLLFRTGAGDTLCGMRGLRKDVVPKMHLQMPGMEFAGEMVIKSRLANLKIHEIPITLHPDGRDRRPHLRSFRDGWRFLRFCLMCSPMVLFVLPGVLLTLAGILSIPAAMLAGYGRYDTFFGPNFMFGSSVIALSGWHLMLFGFLAKLHAHHVNPVFRDDRIERLAAAFTVNRGLVAGLIIVGLSAVVGVPIILDWFETSNVTYPGQWILAGTLFLFGFETIFASFLVGIIDLQRESRRSGYAD
jgi:glycosyltransferase involved in cell wall biosynthesis